MHEMSYYLKYWLEWCLSLKERNLWYTEEATNLSACRRVFNQLLYAGEVEEAKMFALATGLKKYYHDSFLEFVDYDAKIDRDLYDWCMLDKWREPEN